MTNISKKPLLQDQQSKLFDELTTLLGKLSSTNIQSFLENLLGPEEQIMITKRFSAIVLLEKGYSIYQVAKSLHLSTSTLNNLNQKRLSGQYKNIVRWLKKDTNNVKNFLEMLETIMTVGGIMPLYGQQTKALRKML
ncbi:MAG TPA: Trp family transcriptional regulator [Candidatus Paceibacterota bacterium]|nr:Trp family transcriptional regulator [Candidatus Paceibacterota bacterium]